LYALAAPAIRDVRPESPTWTAALASQPATVRRWLRRPRSRIEEMRCYPMHRLSWINC
jgi:hypothetical protein